MRFPPRQDSLSGVQRQRAPAPPGLFPCLADPSSPFHFLFLRDLATVISFLTFLLAASCHSAEHSSSSNRLIVAVGWTGEGKTHSPVDVNLPTVPVRICSSGLFERCYTLRRLLLDTGSSGLRIFSSSIPPSKIRRTGPEKKPSLRECLPFGTSRLWGRVVRLDVMLGREPPIRSLPVQIVESIPEFPPSSPCDGKGRAMSDKSLSGIDGVLGVSPAESDGGYYFACAGQKCRPAFPSLQESVSNPVLHEKIDNNGIVLTFPSLPRKGARSVSGEMLLGIDTSPDNRLPPGVRFFPLERNVFFHATLEKSPRILYGRLDTGTNALVVPTLKLPRCPPPLNRLACPTKETSTSVALIEKGGNSHLFSILAGNAAARLSGSRSVFDDILYMPPESPFSPFILGMPFFFGKTIYLLYPGSSITKEGAFACLC